jgi:hypothetical protein
MPPQTKVNLPQKIATAITRPAPFPFGKGGGLSRVDSPPTKAASVSVYMLWKNSVNQISYTIDHPSFRGITTIKSTSSKIKSWPV